MHVHLWFSNFQRHTLRVPAARGAWSAGTRAAWICRDTSHLRTRILMSKKPKRQTRRDAYDVSDGEKVTLNDKAGSSHARRIKGVQCLLAHSMMELGWYSLGANQTIHPQVNGEFDCVSGIRFCDTLVPEYMPLEIQGKFRNGCIRSLRCMGQASNQHATQSA